MRGVQQFAVERPEWVLLPVANRPAEVHMLQGVKVSGVIAQVYTHGLLRALRPWHNRLVNVSGMLSDLSIPRAGTDNIAVGRIAAEHLLERGFYHFGYVGNPSH